ncbi:hypothetical protein L218DRAFT_884014 [Marasmius fiardii PR-910]|nr:hypothetical protein L218DRAFT_884014 [Marasmius fiardii PR-910]
MVNTAGVNGHRNGICPPDDVLKKILTDLALRKVPLKDQLLYLAKDGYPIQLTTLKELNRKFKIPSVRKPPPLPVATSYVSSIASEDHAARNRPNTVQHLVSRKSGVLIPQCNTTYYAIFFF